MLINIHEKHEVKTKMGVCGEYKNLEDAIALCLKAFCPSANICDQRDCITGFFGYGEWSVKRDELANLVNDLHNLTEHEICRKIIDKHIICGNYLIVTAKYGWRFVFMCNYNILKKFFEDLLEKSDKSNERAFFEVLK